MSKPTATVCWAVRARRPSRAPWRFPRSAGQGIDALLGAIDDVLPFDPIVRARLRLPLGEGATISMVHDLGRVLETTYGGDSCEMEVEIPESLRRRLAGFIAGS